VKIRLSSQSDTNYEYVTRTLMSTYGTSLLFGEREILHAKIVERIKTYFFFP